LYAARRLSMGIGIGNDNFMLPTDFDEASTISVRDFKADMDQSISAMRAKSRRSSLGLLNALMLEDPKTARRMSMSSTISKSLLMDYSLRSDGDMTSLLLDDPANTFEEDHGEGGEEAVDESKPEGFEERGPKIQLDPTLDLTTLKHKIERFASAMDNSAKSQQDIHDWDRKMGLKRSHSKTMRLSMRSRKKLRAAMKRDINALNSVSSL